MLLTKKILEYFPGIDNELLVRTLFEMNRYYDRDLKKHYSTFKKKFNKTLNSFERKMLRLYFYYKDDNILKDLEIEEFPYLLINKKDVKVIEEKTLIKIQEKNKEKIIKSIYSRIEKNYKIEMQKEKAIDWLKNYKKENQYDFISININQQMIKNDDYMNDIYKIINYSYDNLNNYRYISISLNQKIYYNNIDISWNILYKIAVYMENFVEYNKDFRPFNKDKKTKELLDFLNSNVNLKKSKEYSNISKKFYNSISTGFIFNDLLISNNQEKKILIMRKIKPNNTLIPCPVCNSKLIRGNSYPMMFLRSWECQNPKCPERSKSGRGKRFDGYSAYRYFKLVLNNSNDLISNEMYKSWRRDIFDNALDINQMLLIYYSWAGENLLFINSNLEKEIKGRKINCINSEKIEYGDINTLEDLPIYKFFNKIVKKYKKHNKTNILTEKTELFNVDSTKGISKIENGILSAAITSPPYYNARQYSQWKTLIFYLIDMMLNAKSVFDSLSKEGTYLYNVGDIMDKENVYVDSQMSNRRIMLGFYSSFIFEIVGFNLLGNKIWDKGEVQSKRNSTVNLMSGYVKFINCYEHILVFRKNQSQKKIDNNVYKIKPVYKINKKGINTLGHTAPFPEDVVNLIMPYIKKNRYLLDPFLGSGTSGIWAKKQGVNFVGFEVNKKYFELASNRINKEKIE